MTGGLYVPMRGRATRLVLALSVLSLLPSMVQAEAACDPTGVYADSFGTTYLRGAGGAVAGNYTWQNGKLAGTMDGLVLTGTWSEEPTYAGPRDAGSFTWTFSADCSSFGGTYSYAGAPDAVAGSWSGSRASTDVPAGVGVAPAAPTCDPFGDWKTTRGTMEIYAAPNPNEPPVAGHLDSGLPFGEQDASVHGTMTGLTWSGGWAQTIPELTRGTFDATFDATCSTFAGTWYPEELGGLIGEPWSGQRVSLVVPVATPSVTVPTGTEPGSDSAASTDTERETEAEGLPHDVDPDDPLGIPAPGIALLLAILVAVALLRPAKP